MSVCQKPLKINPQCFVHNGGVWRSTIPPKCICNDSIPHQTLDLCKHGRPVKFGCADCALEIRNSLKEDTITIKKTLWDEMVGYKKRIEKLEIERLEKNTFIGNAFSNIQDLKNKIQELQSENETHCGAIISLERKVEILESKINDKEKSK